MNKINLTAGQTLRLNVVITCHAYMHPVKLMFFYTVQSRRSVLRSGVIVSNFVNYVFVYYCNHSIVFMFVFS